MHEVTTNEIMEFLREHMLTKEDGDRLLSRIIALETRQADFATKKDLEDMKSEIMETLDKLVKTDSDQAVEMVAMRSKYDRIEERLTAVEKKVGLSA